jgi:hypothetical protein
MNVDERAQTAVQGRTNLINKLIACGVDTDTATRVVLDALNIGWSLGWASCSDKVGEALGRGPSALSVDKTV